MGTNDNSCSQRLETFPGRVGTLILTPERERVRELLGEIPKPILNDRLCAFTIQRNIFHLTFNFSQKNLYRWREENDVTCCTLKVAVVTRPRVHHRTRRRHENMADVIRVSSIYIHHVGEREVNDG